MTSRVTVTPGVTRIRTNPAADAAFGMTVSAWADGIRSVTGMRYPMPYGKTGAAVADALVDAPKRFPAEDECRSAFLAGAAWARAKAGKDLNEFDFCRWMGSGAHAAPSKPGAPDQQLIDEMADAERQVLANAAARGLR